MSSGPNPFDWGEFISLAQNLLKINRPVSEEAACRAAISRSYYGAFCLARNFAEDNDHVTFDSSSKVHIIIQEHYANETDTAKQKIGEDLRRLRLARNIADYDNICHNIKNKASGSIRRAERVKKVLQNLGGN